MAGKGSDDSREDKMVHHYITRYSTGDGRHFVTSWIQVGCKCFSVRTVEVGAAA